MTENGLNGLKSAILGADDRPFEDVEVEEWGATIRLRGLSGHAAEAFSRRLRPDGDPPDDVMAELLVRVIEDPQTGELVFGADEAARLGMKSSVVLTRLFRRAQKLSGLGELEEAKND